jgi:hypothetical protein
VEHALGEGQVVVDPGGDLADVAAAHEELVADDLGVAGDVFEGGGVQTGHAHGGAPGQRVDRGCIPDGGGRDKARRAVEWVR